MSVTTISTTTMSVPATVSMSVPTTMSVAVSIPTRVSVPAVAVTLAMSVSVAMVYVLDGVVVYGHVDGYVDIVVAIPVPASPFSWVSLRPHQRRRQHRHHQQEQDREALRGGVRWSEGSEVE